jgi:hypothetical protein
LTQGLPFSVPLVLFRPIVASGPTEVQITMGTDRPTAFIPCGSTDRGQMHRPRAVLGGPNIGRFKPVGPKVARPGTSLLSLCSFIVAICISFRFRSLKNKEWSSNTAGGSHRCTDVMLPFVLPKSKNKIILNVTYFDRFGWNAHCRFILFRIFRDL